VSETNPSKYYDRVLINVSLSRPDATALRELVDGLVRDPPAKLNAFHKSALDRLQVAIEKAFSEVSRP
jgi:hypothetical protein